MPRHREFELERALDSALRVFWEKGFEGTSLKDLSAATGVATPGLYAAFGNKEALFLKALDHYEIFYTSFLQKALEESSTMAVMERLLRSSVKFLTGPDRPLGCLGINGALACSEASNSIQAELVARRKVSERALRTRFERDDLGRDLPAGFTAGELASYIMTINHGLAVQAKSNVSFQRLSKVVDLSMRIWAPVR